MRSSPGNVRRNFMLCLTSTFLSLILRRMTLQHISNMRIAIDNPVRTVTIGSKSHTMKIVFFLALQVLHAISNRRRAIVYCLMWSLFLSPAVATSVSAHPLGNFTINHYARLEVGMTEVQLYLVYDFAEIPTFQEKQTLDQNGDETISNAESIEYLASSLDKLGANLSLVIQDQPAVLSLVPNSAQLALLPGQGGLEIMQIRARYSTPLDPNAFPLKIRYRDDNYSERIGWREIVAKPAKEITITKSNVRDTETSDELRNYPQDLLSNPLNDREANFSVARGTSPNAPATFDPQTGNNTTLIVAISAGVITVGILLAIFLLLRRNHSPTA